jgi:hypothetical protein
MKLLVGESSGPSGENVDCNGHVQADFDDLRFTNADGITLLDYWIESITGTTPNKLATVWVEFDSIGTDATTFYMYYGKADAPAYSNGPNTFIFFDDFELGNLSRWSTAESQRSVQSSTKKNGAYAAYGAGAASNRTLAHAITLSDEFCVHYWAGPSITSSYVFYGCFSQEVGGSSYLRIPITLGGLAYGKTQYYDGPYKDYSTPLFFTGGTWSEVNLFIDLPNNQFRLQYNSTLVNNVTTVFTTDNLTAIRNYCSSVTGRNIYLDDFYIRKWNAIEPSWGSWGPEETN